jgi:hypothetical protein
MIYSPLGRVPESLWADSVKQSIPHTDDVRIIGDELGDGFRDAAIVGEHVDQPAKREVSVQRQTATAHALDDLLRVFAIAFGARI